MIWDGFWLKDTRVELQKVNFKLMRRPLPSPYGKEFFLGIFEEFMHVWNKLLNMTIQ